MNDRALKLLVFGGSGLFGSNWLLKCAGEYDTAFTYNRQFIAISNAKAFKFDVFEDNIDDLLNEVRPDIVLNSIGLADVDLCQKQCRRAIYLNTDFPAKLAACTYKLNSKLVHISTDHLFDGSKDCYDENEPLNPINHYGKTKSDGEIQVVNQDPNAIVVRTCFYGWGSHHRSSYTDYIIKQADSGAKLSFPTDVYFSPVYVDDLISVIRKLILINYKGVINVAADKVSKYEFAQMVVQKLGSNSDFVSETRQKPTMSVPRPSNLVLNNKKVLAICGDAFSTSVRDGIESLFSDKQRRTQTSNLGKPIPYGRHYLDKEDVAAVVNVLKFGALTQGKLIEEFENAIAERVGAKYAVAVSSATAGLHLTYMALGLKAGSSIITSPNTFVSTANAAYFCGGEASFCDINRTTLNLDPDLLSVHLSKRSDVKIVVNVLFGGCAENAKKVAELAHSFGVFVVEDAAHALGSKYECGAQVGSCKYSDCTIFSLHPVKSIAAGEGGVITTNDIDIYASLLRLRSHGINKQNDDFVFPDLAFDNGMPNPWYYEMQELGYHYRITDIQCALAISQLKKLDLFLERRRELAAQYDQKVADRDYIKPAQSIDISRSAMHLYPVRVDYAGAKVSRRQVMAHLKSRNIITQVHYIPVTSQPFYRNLGFDSDGFPEAKSYYEEALSLPLFYALSNPEQDFVFETLDQFMVECRNKGSA